MYKKIPINKICIANDKSRIKLAPFSENLLMKTLLPDKQVLAAMSEDIMRPLKSLSTVSKSAMNQDSAVKNETKSIGTNRYT